jgi:hypothetical protein
LVNGENNRGLISSIWMDRVFCVNTPDAWCEIMALTWYVLRSKPNKEDFFWSQLLAHQIEVYYPCIRAKVVNPRARKLKPYFPGYLFVHVDPKEVTTSFLNWLPGSRGLVAFDSQPASVPDALIAAIRHRVDQINSAGGEQLPGLPVRKPFLIAAFRVTSAYVFYSSSCAASSCRWNCPARRSSVHVLRRSKKISLLGLCREAQFRQPQGRLDHFNLQSTTALTTIRNER